MQSIEGNCWAKDDSLISCFTGSPSKGSIQLFCGSVQCPPLCVYSVTACTEEGTVAVVTGLTLKLALISTTGT